MTPAEEGRIMYSRWEAIGRALKKYVAVAGERGFADLGAGPAPALQGYKDAQGLLAYLHAGEGSDPERDLILADLVRAAQANDDRRCPLGLEFVERRVVIQQRFHYGVNVVGPACGFRQQRVQIDIARLGLFAVEMPLLTEQSDQATAAALGGGPNAATA